MSLGDDIRRIRDRAQTALVAAHDYYADTRQMWEQLSDDIAKGRTVGYTNPVTGTATTQVELLDRIPHYAHRLIAESTFQQFLAIFEAFFTDLVRAWLRAYPQNLLSAEPVPVDVVIDAPDKAAITDFLVDRAVIGLMYKKPADWFAFLGKRLKIDRPDADDVSRFAEAKATRDVLVHNQGVANETYVAKAGPLARHPVGEFIDLPEPYHYGVHELLLKIVADLADAVVVKFP